MGMVPDRDTRDRHAQHLALPIYSTTGNPFWPTLSETR